VTETLALDRPQAGTVVLRLNRPNQLNAINEVMRNVLTDTFAAIATDTSVNVVVITGTGRGFCSGIDVRNFAPRTVEASDPAIDRLRFQEAMADGDGGRSRPSGFGERTGRSRGPGSEGSRTRLCHRRPEAARDDVRDLSRLRPLPYVLIGRASSCSLQMR
jgi:hypothetical protein